MKKFVLIFVVILSLSMCSARVYANLLGGSRHFESSGSNYALYVDYSHSSVSTYGYGMIISNAAMYWNHNTSKVVDVSGSLNSNSDRDYVLITYLSDPGIFGKATPLDDYGVEIFDYDSYWHRTQINLYYNNINTKISDLGMNSTDSAAFKKYLVAHEIGHSIKAAHNYWASSYTVMREYWENYSNYYMYSTEYLNSIRSKDNENQVQKWGYPS